MGEFDHRLFDNTARNTKIDRMQIVAAPVDATTEREPVLAATETSCSGAFNNYHQPRR